MKKKGSSEASLCWLGPAGGWDLRPPRCFPGSVLVSRAHLVVPGAWVPPGHHPGCCFSWLLGQQNAHSEGFLGTAWGMAAWPSSRLYLSCA